MRVLSGAEVNRLLDETHDDPHHALWALLLTTGLRLSEALALRWSDLDLDRGELRVLRKLRRPKNGGAWVVEDCKTDKSRRVVPMLAQTVAALRAHGDRQAVERLVAGMDTGIMASCSRTRAVSRCGAMASTNTIGFRRSRGLSFPAYGCTMRGIPPRRCC